MASLAIATIVACGEPDCAELAVCPTAVTSDAMMVPHDARASSDVERPKNRHGEEYPSEHLGWSPRRPGSAIPGDVLPPVMFEHGVEPRGPLVFPSAPSGVLPIKATGLADFYDPAARDQSVVILVLATEWDPSSRLLLDALRRKVPTKAVVLIALGAGVLPGSATLEEFEHWVKGHSWAWNVLDSGFAKLRKLQEIHGASYPNVVLIDARTMEIAWTGANPSTDDVLKEVAVIQARPPAY